MKHSGIYFSLNIPLINIEMFSDCTDDNLRLIPKQEISSLFFNKINNLLYYSIIPVSCEIPLHVLPIFIKWSKEVLLKERIGTYTWK